jgi:hypothetical protein
MHIREILIDYAQGKSCGSPCLVENEDTGENAPLAANEQTLQAY